MSPTRLAAASALACALGTVAACGAGQETATPSTPTSPVPATTASVTPTLTPTLAPTLTPTRTPTRTSAPTTSPTADAGGNGDAEGQTEPATAGGGVCGALSDEEVGAVLGVRVSGKGIAGGGGCEFAQGGAHGMSVTVDDRSSTAIGGMDGAETEATSTVEGEPVSVENVGSEAFIVTGTMFGGTDLQGAGAVRVGNRIISVYLTEESALPRTRVQHLEIELLKLVVSQKS